MMKRDISTLRNTCFDVLVIGAGIHGACIARDAALRGLRVAIVDKADLGGATSHNSLKTLHGGVRYLQHLNIRRTVESIREQLCFKSTLGTHVQPVSFLMPTFGYGMRGPFAMWIGLQLYNVLVALTALRLGQKLPTKRARVISRRRTQALLGTGPVAGLTGGALWSELQVEQADRALLDIVAEAAARNASVASYVEVHGLLTKDGAAAGVTAHDVLNDEGISIEARVVVNAAGPWCEAMLDRLNASAGEPAG